MLKLIKYEFVKKLKLFLILIVTAVIANLGLGLAYKDAGMAIFLGISPIVLGIIYLYELIKTYSEDINKKTGYMLFMTPNSGYKIIGSKLISIILEGLIYFVTYALFVIINGLIIVYRQDGDFHSISEALRALAEGLNMLASGTLGISIGDITLIFIMAIVGAIAFILTIYAAITIRKSIFSDIKFSGLLSFIIFILLNVVIAKLSDILMHSLNLQGLAQQVYDMSNIYPSEQMCKIFTFTIIYNLVIAVGLMFGSGYLLERKINL